MAKLAEIEALTEAYAAAMSALEGEVRTLEDVFARSRREYVPRITDLVAQAVREKAALHGAIEGSPGLFSKPRTFTLHGIKVGLQKMKGKIVVPNEQAAIERIRRFFPRRAEELIEVKESLKKAGLNRLPAQDLRRIGVMIEADSDAVLIKSSADKIEKFVDALLKDAADEAAEAGT